MPHFNINDTIKANTAAQGLKVDALYRVTATSTIYTPFGDFVAYVVRELRGVVDDSDFGFDTGASPQEVLGDPIIIRNAHLLCESVDDVDPYEHDSTHGKNANR